MELRALSSWRESGGRLQRRGLRPQRIDHGLRNVFSAARIVVDRLNGVNRSPRDAPPTGNQRQQREREALYHWVFTLPEKVNIGRPPEREDDDGDAVLEKDELRPSLNLEVQLAVLHAFDAANLGSHSGEYSIATRSQLPRQARFSHLLTRCAAPPAPF